MVHRETLISYALSFASFLLDTKIGAKINKIILFGSVARGDFTKESDIDLFIDTKEKFVDEIDKILILFKESQINKIWQLKGANNDISLKNGDLKKWGLRREVISSGIMLYGKYNELPDETRYYLLVQIEVKNKNSAEQMHIWRELYGYVQKVGNKSYVKKGLVEIDGGRKLGKATFIVLMENRKSIIDFLNKNKIRYSLNEVWSDTL